MQNSIGREAYDEMVAKIGKQEADRRVREYGWEILPASSTAPAENVMRAVPASEVNNLLGQGGLSTAMGGGDNMEEDDLNVANEDAADNAAADENATDAYASLGGLSAMDLTDPKQISQAILANSANQKRYYDSLANQIRQRRYGPSESEKLLALSAAFFKPTTVRGFSGTMGNVLPVLQKFGELKRDEEEKRAEALQGLAKQRMALAQGDVKTAIDLQRLLATYNKNPYSNAVFNPEDKSWNLRPGTLGAPPVLTPEQAAEMAKNPANKGKLFYTTEGQPRRIGV